MMTPERRNRLVRKLRELSAEELERAVRELRALIRRSRLSGIDGTSDKVNQENGRKRRQVGADAGVFTKTSQGEDILCLPSELSPKIPSTSNNLLRADSGAEPADNPGVDTKPKNPAEPDEIVMWGHRLSYQLGAPDQTRDFELIRLMQRIDELEADKKNLLANLSQAKVALQLHDHMWMVGFREKIWPTYSQARQLQLKLQSAIGALDRLTNGRASAQLLPEGHPWLKEK